MMIHPFPRSQADRESDDVRLRMRSRNGWTGLVPTALAVLAGAAIAAPDGESTPITGLENSENRMFHFGEMGLEFESGETSLWLGIRLQSRYDSLPGTLNEPSDLTSPEPGEWSLHRGRIKGGGPLIAEWFEIYSEYDFTTNGWLDYRATMHLGDDLSFRVGQWKSDFNRERIDSSGAQQFVDRSISNYWFTLDRQLGLSAKARLAPGGPIDSMLWLEFLSGRGLGANFDDDSGLWMLRWQWNPAGEMLGFGQADLKRHKKPVSEVTLATVYGDTHYTRFSSTGGGQLPGFTYGDYRIFQLMFETAARWRGLSWQQELHWKEIEDRQTAGRRRLWGGYGQVGAFPSEFVGWVPEPLELVARVASVDPDTSISSDRQWEWTLGANWYFDGHRNKISTDVSLLDFDDPLTGYESGLRFRVQWDVSF